MATADGLQERIEQVNRRVEAACARVGRASSEVRILPVSKTYGPDAVRAVSDCGFKVFGENRVQEARQKIPLCPEHLEWHLIGHLQSNKVRDAVRCFQMIHAADSTRLLEMIDGACREAGRAMPVCLEVNVSGEGTKFGLAPEDVAGVMEDANRLFQVQVVGLMTVPPPSRDPEDARPHFRRLRELRDDLRSRSGLALPELSMGMSGDFEVAIEEGATWIRLGSVIFGPRERPAPRMEHDEP
jgi:PLP dependent protein